MWHFISWYPWRSRAELIRWRDRHWAPWSEANWGRDRWGRWVLLPLVLLLLSGCACGQIPGPSVLPVCVGVL